MLGRDPRGFPRARTMLPPAHRVADLPPVAPAAVSAVERTDKDKMDPEARKVWVRRRRSSSAAEFGMKWSEDIDRLKEELNDREKAQNVRRAVKMQQVRLEDTAPAPVLSC